MRFLVVLACLCALAISARTQSNAQIYGLKDLTQSVRTHNPIAKQAQLIASRGRATVTQARGSFDPKLVSDYNTKSFDGKDYYQVWDSYVKVPTRFNIDLKAGYERNNGTYLNPQSTVPEDGLYYAGISVPIGQGLIHNERNINLKQGKLDQEGLENEATHVLNNLMLDAQYAYWDWYERYNIWKLIEANQTLLQERYNGVVSSVNNGEYAAIDTVEMMIQVQQWNNMSLKAKVEYENSLLLLQNFVWDDSVKLTSQLPQATDSLDIADVQLLLDNAQQAHPELNQYRLSVSSLELQRKWSAEQLKPKLDVNYNFLLSGQEKENSLIPFENNYKAGFQFSYPIFTRKERSKLTITKIKQQETGYKLDQKAQEIQNKIRAYHNKVLNLDQIIQNQEIMIENYKQMVRSEQIKFDNGESSIFILNYRENKRIDAEIKLIQTKSDYAKAVANMYWAAGTLANG